MALLEWPGDLNGQPHSLLHLAACCHWWVDLLGYCLGSTYDKYRYIYTHLCLHVAWIKYKKSNKNMDQNKEGDDPSQRVWSPEESEMSWKKSRSMLPKIPVATHLIYSFFVKGIIIIAKKRCRIYDPFECTRCLIKLKQQQNSQTHVWTFAVTVLNWKHVEKTPGQPILGGAKDVIMSIYIYRPIAITPLSWDIASITP